MPACFFCIYICGINHSLENLYLLYAHKPVFVPIAIERHGCENVIPSIISKLLWAPNENKPHMTSRQFPHVGNIRKIIALLNAPLVYILDLAHLLIQLPLFSVVWRPKKGHGVTTDPKRLLFITHSCVYIHGIHKTISSPPYYSLLIP